MQQLASYAFFVSRLLFILTAVNAARATWRSRDTHRFNILMVVAALLFWQWITPKMGPLGHFVRVALFLAVPYFMLRLVGHFRRVPRFLQLGALAVILPGTAAVLLRPPENGFVLDTIQLYVAAMQTYAAIAFTREVRRTSGVTAKRLIFAAAGNWLFAAGRVLTVVSPFIINGGPYENDGAHVLVIINAGMYTCFFFAFDTPRRLRSAWQRTEQARYLSNTADRDAEERGRHAADDLNRAALRIAGNAATFVALRTEPSKAGFAIRAASAPSLVGLPIFAGTGLIGRACQTGTGVTGAPGQCEPEIADRLASFGAQVLVVPIVTSTHVWGVAVVVQQHGSLFPDDDLHLLTQLGRYAGTALDHAYLVTQARDRERRAADRRLREAESRMSLMLDSIKDYAMFVLDEHGRVVAWHTGAEHLFGYRAEEMQQEPAAPLYNMSRADFEALLDESRRFGLADQEGECRRRDGGKFIGATIVRPLKTEEDGLPGFVAVTRDVTERRELEDRLRQSQKLEAIGQLAGGIAHDFNNLLTAILGYSDWLARDFADDEVRLQQIGEITKAGERAAALTRQLLTFSRKKLLEPSAVNIARLVTELLPMLARIIGEHVEIVHEPSAEALVVLGDRSQVEQVVMNLAVNARDAMTSGGTLTIRTVGVWLDDAVAASEVPTGRYVMLEVTDTGTGIDALTQRRMFEPFFTTKDVGSGTGLGLATVYGIVKQMNGIIRVQSALGVGTSFRLYFPESKVREAAVVVPGVEARVPTGHETLLLVEDEEVVRLFLTKVLERSGYKLIVAERPDVALALVNDGTDPIHLVITDIVLPGGTGPELIKALWQIRPGLPVLYISGYADAVLAQQGTFPKASHFMQKPFSAADLLSRVRQILGADPHARAGLTT